MDLPKLRPTTGANLINDETGAVAGEIFGMTGSAAEMAKRCNEYPGLKKAAERCVESEVWSRFAAGYMAGQLAAQDVKNENDGGTGIGVYKATDGSDIAGEAATAADSLLALWKKRFAP